MRSSHGQQGDNTTFIAKCVVGHQAADIVRSAGKNEPRTLAHAEGRTLVVAAVTPLDAPFLRAALCPTSAAS